jgi:exoribonuclease R
MIGVLELASKYRYGITSHGSPLYLFRSYDGHEYIVGSASRETENQIAVVDAGTTVVNGKPRGNLSRIIGPVGDYAAEREALLLHYCPTKPVESLAELADEPREEISAATGWTTFHIDPPGCRDIDDAVAYHPEHGWAITIADAAAAVAGGSPTDLAAAAIGATFYDLDGRAVRTMLPPSISEDRASLLPGQRRRGVTLFLGTTLKALEAKETRFGLTWITVEHSFTYDSFPGSKIANALGVTTEPHAWIEELMIRYNREVAAILKRNTGFLRVQPAADTELPTSLRFLAMEAATYEIVDHLPQTHATIGGLYCHASSPLRRYADLANQRILSAYILRLPIANMDNTVDHLNERARANRRWSRDLTFLTHVTPGRVHEVDVIWFTADRVWVPLWRRLIRLRHEESRPAGTEGRIRIFCDPTKRNWKERILTAPFLPEP